MNMLTNHRGRLACVQLLHIERLHQYAHVYAVEQGPDTCMSTHGMKQYMQRFDVAACVRDMVCNVSAILATKALAKICACTVHNMLLKS